MGVASAAAAGDRNFRLKGGTGGGNKLSIEDMGGEIALKLLLPEVLRVVMLVAAAVVILQHLHKPITTERSIIPPSATQSITTDSRTFCDDAGGGDQQRVNVDLRQQRRQFQNGQYSYWSRGCFQQER